MVSTLLFVIVALRALIELVVWVMVGRAILRALAGRAGADNVILRLFDTILRPPRKLVAAVLPRASFAARELLLFCLLVSLWLSLAVGKWWLLS